MIKMLEDWKLWKDVKDLHNCFLVHVFPSVYPLNDSYHGFYLAFNDLESALKGSESFNALENTRIRILERY